MNEIREIVTKAVIAKGKKTITLKEEIIPEFNTYSILGVWIINHQFDVIKQNDIVTVDGEFEVNIWYSQDENTKTNICRKKINYQKNIHTRQIVKDYIENSDDAIARIKKHPTCIDAKINDNKITLEIELELICEVIGETKMQVTVFTEPEVWDVDDFENEIDEDFIKDN